MHRKFAVPILLAAIFCLTPLSSHAQSSGKYSAGQRVMADPTGLGNFRAGVVTEVLPFDRYRVQLDDEVGRYDATVMLSKNMKPSSAPPPAVNANGFDDGELKVQLERHDE